MEFDAIIAGGRCAGSAVALRLQQAGRRVLLLDRDEFPSDNVVSTHMVWHAGIARLHRWGVLERLEATGCPPMRDFSLDVGEFTIHGRAPSAGAIDRCYAPRRYALDTVLHDAARDAGAHTHRGVVNDLLEDAGRVVGVRYSGTDGTTLEARAPIVIGADGSNSQIARLTAAPLFHHHPKSAGTIWAYFSGLPLEGMEFFARPGRMYFTWNTNDGLTVFGVSARYEDFGTLAEAPDATIAAELRAWAPALAERLAAAHRESAWHKAAVASFCRKPHGPGWALVGDAGATVDPITAAGISNAFRDADLLADAIESADGAETLDAALAAYALRRDEALLPLYEFTCQMAKLDPPPPEFIDLLVALRDNRKDAGEYFGVFAQTVPVQRFFAPENLARIINEATASARE